MDQASMLEYEIKTYKEIEAEDGLIIVAKGLGIERIFSAFVDTYCDSSFLEFVLNAKSADENYVIDSLINREMEYSPRILTTDWSTNQRFDEYLKAFEEKKQIYFKHTVFNTVNMLQYICILNIPHM